jgi:AbrB family looped-hinge helix DNA binding protein
MMGGAVTGFSEASEGFAGGPAVARVKVGPDGRILIPAELRRAAGLEPGASVVVTLQGQSLTVETPLAQIRKVQALLAPLKRPGDSIVDELIAERRAEAARE